MNERVLKVLHDIIDGLGGGHQHLHAALADASVSEITPVTDCAPTPGAEQTGNEDASSDPKKPGA